MVNTSDIQEQTKAYKSLRKAGGPVWIDDYAREHGYTISEALTLLTLLELRGMARMLTGKRFEAITCRGCIAEHDGGSDCSRCPMNV